jgi:hypothetical protein
MAPTTVRGPLGITYQLIEKQTGLQTVYKTCSHLMTCDENYEQLVEIRVQALASVEDTSLGKAYTLLSTKVGTDFADKRSVQITRGLKPRSYYDPMTYIN